MHRSVARSALGKICHFAYLNNGQIIGMSFLYIMLALGHDVQSAARTVTVPGLLGITTMSRRALQSLGCSARGFRHVGARQEVGLGPTGLPQCASTSQLLEEQRARFITKTSPVKAPGYTGPPVGILVVFGIMTVLLYAVPRPLVVGEDATKTLLEELVMMAVQILLGFGVARTSRNCSVNGMAMVVRILGNYCRYVSYIFVVLQYHKIARLRLGLDNPSP